MKKIESKKLNGRNIELGKKMVKDGKYGVIILAGGQRKQTSDIQDLKEHIYQTQVIKKCLYLKYI